MNDFDDDYDTNDFGEDYADELADRDAHAERFRCVLGADCLHPDPFHTSDECFDVEMAEEHMRGEP